MQILVVIAVSSTMKITIGLLFSSGHLLEGLEVFVGDRLAASASPSGHQVPFGAQDNGRRSQW
jgi:hypothetical protein